MSLEISCAKSIVQKRVKHLNLIQYAKENREEGFFNDVCINVESQCISANRIILACSSPYFEKHLKTMPKEQYEQSLKIEGPESEAVIAIIDYFYSESIEITNKNVMKLLAASAFLEVDEIMQFCFEFLQSVIEPENAYAFFRAVSSYSCESFSRFISEFISIHFNAVIQSTDFKDWTDDDFTKFLSIIKRELVSESSVYQTLILWVRSDQANRQKMFAKLFQQTIDLDKMSMDLIEDVVLNEQLIKDDVACHQLVLTKFSKLLKEQRAVNSQQHQPSIKQTSPFHEPHEAAYVLMSPPPLPSRCRENPPALLPKNFPVENQLASPQKSWQQTRKQPIDLCKPTFENELFTYAQELMPRVIGVGNGCYSKKVCDVYNLYGQALLNYPSLPQEIAKYCSLYHSNRVFCIGGDIATTTTTGSKPTSKVWKMNLKEKALQWTETAPMSMPRYEMGAAVYEDKLVVAGGNAGMDVALSSVEFYEVAKNKWKTISPMNLPRRGNALVACDGCLYTLGGEENYCSVERLEKLKGKWKLTKPMQTGRSNFAAVHLNGMIYAIGGENDELAEDLDDCERLKSVERYNPTKNAWRYVKDMNFKRSDHCACVLDEKIFVFGGKDEYGQPIFEIESYNPANDNWIIVGEAINEIHGHSIVAV